MIAMIADKKRSAIGAHVETSSPTIEASWSDRSVRSDHSYYVETSLKSWPNGPWISKVQICKHFLI